MSKDEKHEAPIIIINKKGGHGHHGGSWKVAFADFMTAMMAFFLLMWLLGGTSDEEKKQIAGYFQHPEEYKPIYDISFTALISPATNIPAPASSPDTYDSDKTHKSKETPEEQPIDAQTAEMDKIELQNLKNALEDQIDKNPDVAPYKDQIRLSSTPEGLRVEIIDNAKRPMFLPGSAKMSENAYNILLKLAPTINRVPNKISISGHTDSKPLQNNMDYSNWDLSADRANEARRSLEEGGLAPQKIARVVGMADMVVYDKKDPEGPLNRRISIIILNKQTEREIVKPTVVF